MRFRVGLALSLSIILIASATLFRVFANGGAEPGLVAVEKDTASNPLAGDDIYMPEGKVATSTPKNLTTTDLIGRQLISDYLALATNGQADEDSINSLADKYVESVGGLQTAPAISLLEVRTVANTKANFQIYADALMSISRSAKTSAAGIDPINADTPEADLYAAAKSLASVYSSTAAKMQVLGVPVSLAASHVKLVNHYLANASAMDSLSRTEEDSALAFAGIASLSRNFSEEDTILLEIVKILNANGI